MLEPDRAPARSPRARACASARPAAEATCLARDLVNEPANVVTPTLLAARAEEIAQERQAQRRACSTGRTCEKLGMGAYLGVAQGSEEPPKFIHLTYVPKGRPRRRVAVIGKGITFDSGGLDLKTADGMLRMKDDMSGAAAVLGVFQALPRLKPPVEVHGLIAATENMPSGTAQRPGDIVRAMNGLTIEIGNTDAEGRLTLADALAYAVKEIKPDEMIDMATLTGRRRRRARASGVSGLFASHDGLASRLLAAASARGRADVAAAAARRVQGGHQERRGRPEQHLEPARRRRHRRRAVHARLHRGGCRGRISTSRAPPSPSGSYPLGPKGATGVGVRTAPRLSATSRSAASEAWRRRRPAHAHDGVRRHARPRRAGARGRAAGRARPRRDRPRLDRGPRPGHRGGRAPPAASDRARHRDQLRRRGRGDPHPRLLHGLRDALVSGLLPSPAARAARARPPHGGPARRARHAHRSGGGLRHRAGRLGGPPARRAGHARRAATSKTVREAFDKYLGCGQAGRTSRA